MNLLDYEESGPNKLARDCETTLAELLPKKGEAMTEAERKKLNARIKQLRSILRWAKTRLGYVEPPKQRSRGMQGTA